MTRDMGSVSLVVHMARVPDHRLDRTKRHQLSDILVIVVCATLCGAEGPADVEEWGKARLGWLKTFLDLPNGIPSHDTIGRVLAAMEPDVFRRCFLEWVRGFAGVLDGQVVLDGKTLRRSFDTGAERGAIHIVSAWSRTNQLVLGQVKVDDKSNEITAIPTLLDLLDINGCIVTIDAMGTQKEIAAKIFTDKRADYVLAVKGNQPGAMDAVKNAFAPINPVANKKAKVTAHETHDEKHGRTEHRVYTAMPAPADPALAAWVGLKTIVRVERNRFSKGAWTCETHFYFTSRAASARTLEGFIRGHWTIENQLHWCLDVAFNEDQSRIHKDHAPENAAIIRHFALNLLKLETTKKRGLKAKMKAAGWSNDYLMELLRVAPSAGI